MTDTATDPTPSGPVPVVKKRAAKTTRAPQPPAAEAVDAGQRLLDQLAADDLPVEPTDPGLYALGCILSAAAMHVPAGARSTVVLLNPPAGEGDEIEIRATTAEAAAQIAAALPWKNPPHTHTLTFSVTRHIETRGLLWGRRVLVVGVEELPGGAR